MTRKSREIKSLIKRKGEVVRMAREGHSRAHIAKVLSEHRPTVTRWLNQAGIETNSHTQAVGLLGEAIVRDHLLEMGIQCEPTAHACEYDLLTSCGIRIEVKTCATVQFSHLGKKRARFDCAKLRGTLKDYPKDYGATCDFVVLLFAGDDAHQRRFWVCRPSDLPDTGVLISLYPTAKSSKWAAFENRFDLIKAAMA